MFFFVNSFSLDVMGRLCFFSLCHFFLDTVFNITKTRLYNFDPLKAHIDIVKLGFTGVYIIFFYFAKKTYFVGTR